MLPNSSAFLLESLVLLEVEGVYDGKARATRGFLLDMTETLLVQMLDDGSTRTGC